MTSRRDAVCTLAGIAALPFFGTLDAEELVEVGRRAHAIVDLRKSDASLVPPRALTAAEYDIVSQAAERIIPRTATPGACDARVADFIDVMLADWYNASDGKRFKTGLSELDARAKNLAGRAFVKTTEKQQTELLETHRAHRCVRRQIGARLRRSRHRCAHTNRT